MPAMSSALRSCRPGVALSNQQADSAGNCVLIFLLCRERCRIASLVPTGCSQDCWRTCQACCACRQALRLSRSLLASGRRRAARPRAGVVLGIGLGCAATWAVQCFRSRCALYFVPRAAHTTCGCWRIGLLCRLPVLPWVHKPHALLYSLL